MSRKQNGIPQRPTSGPPIGLATRPLLPKEEEQILQEVRQTVWLHYTQGPRLEKQPSIPTRSWEAKKPNQRLWLAAPTLAFVAALLIWWIPSSSTVETLLVEDGNKRHIQTHLKRINKREVHIKTSKSPKQISVAKRWKIQVAPRSQVVIEQKNNQHHLVQLDRGDIDVDVIPHRIKLLEVALPQYHIHVKGTRFTVKRGASWWRIEMHHGRVQLAMQNTPSTQAPQGPFLGKGQGARVDQRTGKIERFLVPEKAHRSPKKRVAWWLARNTPETALQWLGDYIEQHPKEKTFYARSLQEVAEHFRGRKDLPKMLALLVQIHQLQVPGESEFALPEALATCRQTSPNNACLQVFQLFLQQKNPGPFAEHALFWLAVGMIKQSQASKEESTRLLLRYLGHFPKGEHIPRVLDMLRKTSPSLKKACHTLSTQLPKKDKPAWWRSICPSH
ncbi:MAG: FecR domain-containing protein [Myxococcales bacterium]|nr:FecR domain-containing protein [Myxococcales bacterium]